MHRHHSVSTEPEQAKRSELTALIVSVVMGGAFAFAVFAPIPAAVIA